MPSTLASGEQALHFAKRIDPVKILTIPGIIDLESKLLLRPPKNGILAPDVDVDYISAKVFGDTQNDTLFDAPEGYEDHPEGSIEWYRVQFQISDHEYQYATADLADDEAVKTG